MSASRYYNLQCDHPGCEATFTAHVDRADAPEAEGAAAACEGSVIRSYDNGSGPRFVVPLGGVDHVLTMPEAIALRDGISHEVNDVARRARLGEITSGCTVEWDPWNGGKARRATVHRVAQDGRVYVRWPRRPTRSNPAPYTESWFDADEVDRLRVVTP